MKRFDLVHNIIPPYRRHMFELMSREFDARGWRFYVHFMAKNHNNRPSFWHAEKQCLNFEHRFYCDIGPKVRGREIHFNPMMILRMLFLRSDAVMVAGMDTLTSAIMVILSDPNKTIYWTEGNPNHLGKTKGLVSSFKKFILNRFKYFAIPGSLSAVYLNGNRRHDVVAENLVRLSNVVDGSAFLFPSDSAIENAKRVLFELGVTNDDSLAIWPARLSHEKGILEFLPFWIKYAPADWKLIILGEGELRECIIKVIGAANFENRIHVVSYVNPNDMPGFYSNASLMLLPSLIDPNPLSIVEALYSGLPIITTNRIGNHPEAIQHGVNGWLVTVSDEISANEAIAWATTLSQYERDEISKYSHERAQKYWGAEVVVKQFVDFVVNRIG
jgi:glycosyltransferase involved in cell wall biosynthesis